MLPTKEALGALVETCVAPYRGVEMTDALAEQLRAEVLMALVELHPAPWVVRIIEGYAVPKVIVGVLVGMSRIVQGPHKS